MPKSAIVVSCDEDVLAFCQAVLPSVDYEMISATEHTIVVRTLFDIQPELVFLDLDLCRGMAADILHWIGTQVPPPQLVLVSSGENLQVLREGFVVPKFQLLIKPLHNDEMQAAMDVVLRHRGNSRAPGSPEGRLVKKKEENRNE